MHFPKYDWEVWRQGNFPQYKSLTSLRYLRDQLAADLAYEAESWFGKKEADELVDCMCRYADYSNSYYHKLRAKLKECEHLTDLEKLDVLWLCIRRIARLERERADYYVPAELATA